MTAKSALHPVARLPDEWAAELAPLGERPFRAKQIFRIHGRGVHDAAQMSDLAAPLREKLAAAGLGEVAGKALDVVARHFMFDLDTLPDIVLPIRTDMVRGGTSMVQSYLLVQKTS